MQLLLLICCPRNHFENKKSLVKCQIQNFQFAWVTDLKPLDIYVITNQRSGCVIILAVLFRNIKLANSSDVFMAKLLVTMLLLMVFVKLESILSIRMFSMKQIFFQHKYYIGQSRKMKQFYILLETKLLCLLSQPLTHLLH